MDTFEMFCWAGYSQQEALILDQELTELDNFLQAIMNPDDMALMEERFNEVYAEAATLQVPYDLLNNDIDSPLTCGGSATPTDQPVVVDSPTDLAQPAPDMVPLAWHPAAPDWPHPKDAFITVGDYKTENLVRLCTMMSCPVCGEAYPADMIVYHLQRHYAPYIVNRSTEICCAWDDCGRKLKFRSLKNHVEAIHLRLTNIHCPHCHLDSRYENGRCSHTALFCSARPAAMKGEKLYVDSTKTCSKWCNAWRRPDELPQFKIDDSYHAVIIGPFQPPHTSGSSRED
ncbi:hypothetical protein TRAPUB_3166 [Trametes pubescens]|uniref:Uncharacterized protein n=1 Tax=Trametes pubescens TaxID=154538 RepID=A0A1M2VED6_TRAPU|nr:hypothetical protein TRAPUB_3166 [Trametes pubescens]